MNTSVIQLDSDAAPSSDGGVSDVRKALSYMRATFQQLDTSVEECRQIIRTGRQDSLLQRD